MRILICVTVALSILFSASPIMASMPAPAGVSSVGTSPSHIQVNWSYAYSANGFYIERAPQGTTMFVRIATVGASARSYINVGLYAETGYSYRVRAYKSNRNFSPYSSTVNALTFPLQPPVITFAPVPVPIATTVNGIYSSATIVSANVVVDGLRPTDAISYFWAEKSGPNLATVVSPDQLTTQLSLPESGTYVFSFTATVTPDSGTILTATKDLGN